MADLALALRKFEADLKEKFKRLKKKDEARAALAQSRRSTVHMTARERAIAALRAKGKLAAAPSSSASKGPSRGKAPSSKASARARTANSGQRVPPPKRPRTSVPRQKPRAAAAKAKASPAVANPLDVLATVAPSSSKEEDEEIGKKWSKIEDSSSKEMGSRGDSKRRMPRQHRGDAGNAHGEHPPSRRGGKGKPRRKQNPQELYPMVQYERNKFGYQVEQFVSKCDRPDDPFPLGPIKNDEIRRRIHKSNYHLRQNQAEPLHVKNLDLSMRNLTTNDFPRRAYRRRKKEFKSVNHWSQRQTVVEEIEFLTKHAGDKDYVVYIGAAPGSQIPYLAELFPMLEFHLYDTNEFRIESRDRIFVNKTNLTSTIEKEWQQWQQDNANVLLISKLKGAADEHQDANELSPEMKSQAETFKAIKPKKALLRFALPWGEGMTTYLDGELILPIWGTQTTTELLLVPDDDAREREWDRKQFEEWMFYFNTIMRVQYYRHSVFGVRGLDHCYDCASEILVLQRYLEKHYNTFVTQWELIEGGARSADQVPQIQGRPSDDLIKQKLPLFHRQLSKVSSLGANRELFFNPPPSLVRAQWYYSTKKDDSAAAASDGATTRGAGPADGKETKAIYNSTHN